MAGTFAFSTKSAEAGRVVNSLTLEWTSDGSGNATVVSDDVRGVILRIVTNPGSAAPTDSYDATLTDADGIDVAAGLLVDRDTTNSESVWPVDLTSGLPFAVSGPLTLNISNAGSAKNGTVVVYFR
jgi:hypothetical protein